LVDNLLPRFIAQHLYGSLHCRFHKQQITGLQDQYTFIKVEGMPFLGRVERNIPLHILAESKQNEPFLLFFIRFFTDSLFRLSRIEFPIPCKQENRLIVDDKGEVAEAPCFEYDEEA